MPGFDYCFLRLATRRNPGDCMCFGRQNSQHRINSLSMKKRETADGRRARESRRARAFNTKGCASQQKQNISLKTMMFLVRSNYILSSMQCDHGHTNLCFVRKAEGTSLSPKQIPYVRARRMR